MTYHCTNNKIDTTPFTIKIWPYTVSTRTVVEVRSRQSDLVVIKIKNTLWAIERTEFYRYFKPILVLI